MNFAGEGDGTARDDFRAYVRCGILAHGFARVRCGACAAERLVAFSCKGRGVCPSCNARRMVEVAAQLTDQVLPPLPLRQWVLSLPKRIRPFLPHDPRLAGDVLRILLRAIRTTLQRASPGAHPDAQLGAVSFLHRFGSALNAHFHFHVVVLDGVFSEEPDGSITFHEATHLSADDVHRLQRTLQRRVLRLFRRRGLLDDPTVADMLTWQGAGGFSLDASVRIHGSDSAGRERLIRYCARPPFALERLRIERHADGTAPTRPRRWRRRSAAPSATPTRICRCRSSSRLDRQAAGPRFRFVLMLAFGAVALTLAVMGVYGVTHFAVSRRTREIGIRLALGARTDGIVRDIVSSSVFVALAGCALGLALAAARVVQTLLFRTSALDPAILAGAAAVVLASAIGAAWLPARRATRVDPVAVLRAD